MGCRRGERGGAACEGRRQAADAIAYLIFEQAGLARSLPPPKCRDLELGALEGLVGLLEASVPKLRCGGPTNWGRPLGLAARHDSEHSATCLMAALMAAPCWLLPHAGIF